jgi:hypothetical protein
MIFFFFLFFFKNQKKKVNNSFFFLFGAYAIPLFNTVGLVDFFSFLSFFLSYFYLWNE